MLSLLCLLLCSDPLHFDDKRLLDLIASAGAASPIAAVWVVDDKLLDILINWTISTFGLLSNWN